MDPLTVMQIAVMLFQGLGAVEDLFKISSLMKKLFNGTSKYELVTPIAYPHPLLLCHNSSLFQNAQVQSQFPPIVTGYLPGVNLCVPQPQFYQHSQSLTASRVFKQHFPTVARLSASTSSSGSSHHVRGTYGSTSFPSSSHHPPYQLQDFGFSGSTIQLIKEQEAGDTYIDDGRGMSTGGNPHFTNDAALAHWNLFQRSGHRVSGHNSTIAVVDWTAGLVTMFVQSGSKYYRNYRVSHVDVALFASTFQHNEVCSGIIRDQHLEAINKFMALVPDNMQYGGFVSNNCWTFLGLPCPEESLEELGPAFVEAPRGVIFGIINCLYTAPHRLNVDMKRLAYNLDFVHIDCLGSESALGKTPKRDCAFTVFEFATNGWAHEKVLVG